MVKRKIGTVKPRENPFVESAHPFQHLAADDDRVGLRLGARSRFNIADRLMPVLADKVLVLAEMTSTNRAPRRPRRGLSRVALSRPPAGAAPSGSTPSLLPDGLNPGVPSRTSSEP